VLYLASDGRANSDEGTGRLTALAAAGLPDLYIHDPATPVPTVCRSSVMFSYDLGPYDQRPIQARRDVLVYTSPRLAESLTIAGVPHLRFWAASSGRDADFAVHLNEVGPEGESRLLTFGVSRARFRAGFDKPRWLTPGEVEPYDVELRPVAHQLAAGSRVRLTVAGSCFPLIDRNAGCAVEPGQLKGSDYIRTTQAVYHDSARPSALHLPCVGQEPLFA